MRPVKNVVRCPSNDEFKCPNCSNIIKRCVIIDPERVGASLSRHWTGQCPICGESCCFTCGIVLR
jgi:hypothetical protein